MSVTEEFRDKVAREVPARLQDLEGARIVSESTCETGDSTTPDNLPIIDDPADGPSGLIVATGLHGVGITLSPATGTAVRSILTCEECPFHWNHSRSTASSRVLVDFEFVPLMLQETRLL